MGTSQAQKAESRERILSAAATQIRAGGLDSVSIADLMKSAGLTHGAFYAHFPSRTALLTAALERALEDGKRNGQRAYGTAADGTLSNLVDAYLSASHRDLPHKGCALPSLASDTARADNETQQVMRDHLESFINDLAARIGDVPDAREKAVAAWSTMVGAITLSRLFGDSPLGDEILAAAREAVLRDSVA